MLRSMRIDAIWRIGTGILLPLFVVACGRSPSDKPITVGQFISEIDRLDGQTVAVTGFLGECEALSCRLYRNERESAAVGRAMSTMRAALDKGATDVSDFPFPDHPAVSIGAGSPWSFFDLKAHFYQNSYVVITGRADSQCRSANVACFDRADELAPFSIRSAPAPS